jgi:hypothetical protein
MHSAAVGGGATRDNRNALKYGRYTAELRALLREADEALELAGGIFRRE